MYPSFKGDIGTLSLTSPEYETNIFGGLMGELRQSNDTDSSHLPIDDIYSFLKKEGFLACTFRGNEDVGVVRRLNELGFKFVGTFSEMSCCAEDFRGIKICNNSVSIALESDYEDMANICHKVFDYSTYQIDNRFPNRVTSYRNVLRLKSYFGNPDHRSYVIKHFGEIAGYIQFVIDGQTAHTVNAAIDPSCQGMFFGVKLFTDAFKHLFSSGIKRATTGYCNQNRAIVKIYNAFNFKLDKHEIHLRLLI